MTGVTASVSSFPSLWNTTLTRSGTPAPRSVMLFPLKATRPSKISVCARSAITLRADMLNGWSWPMAPVTASRTRTSRSPAGNGSGRSRRWLTALNIAVFAPMPSARIATAIAEFRGVRFSKRTP